jgi:hypothetical protein
MTDFDETEQRNRNWRVFIYGGCVSRDTVEFSPAGRYELVRYIARHSLLSAGSDAGQNLPPIALESRFQKKMVDLDVVGGLLGEIHKARICDVILWDLNVERVGVWMFEDQTIVTNSAELRKVPEVKPRLKSARLIEFGTDEHYWRWSGAARIFIEGLRQLGLASRVVVLAPEWAMQDELGQATGRIAGKTADEYNAEYSRYVGLLESLGLSVVRIPETTSAVEHKWGKAPFHYSQEVYRELNLEILHRLVGERDFPNRSDSK